MRALMKKSSPTARRIAAMRFDLQVERMKPFAADHLVLEIAADRAGLGLSRATFAPPSSGSVE